MSNIESIFLIIAAAAISIFFLILIALSIYAWVSYRRIIKKAEAAIDNVESVSYLIKTVGAKTPAGTIYKVIKYIISLSRSSSSEKKK